MWDETGKEMRSPPMLTSPMVNIKLRRFPNCSGVTLNRPTLVSITAPVKLWYRLNASNLTTVKRPTPDVRGEMKKKMTYQ